MWAINGQGDRYGARKEPAYFPTAKSYMMELLSEIRECWVKDSNSNKVTKVLEEMDDMQVNMWKVISNL